MSWTVLAEATEKTDGLNTGQLVFLIGISLAFASLIPFVFLMMRRTFRAIDKQMQFLQRQSDHMDATERHMAAVDQTLAQILEELKRRPLS